MSSLLGAIDWSSTNVQLLLAIFVTALATLFTCYQLYCKLTLGRCVARTKMQGKTVVITGANGGIGKETTRDLARRGARVIMACRNVESATAVRDEIVKETGNADLHVRQLDLSSQQSVRQFAAEVLRTETRIDVLIHNAGIALAIRSQRSVDDIELTMATNHYGPFLLTHLLIDRLKQTPRSRIVVVASELYRLASVNLNNLNPLNTKPSAYLYYVSKYANIYFTRELARRLEGTGVTANCLHPGMIDTGIWRNVPFPFNYPMQLITRGFFKTPEQGAQTTIYLAVDPAVEGVSGQYYMDCEAHDLNQAAQDMVKAAKLWEESAKLVKLTAADPKI